jgi:citrate/tricarballylate utilization protein
MSTESIIEARRQIEICNACRYCEGYCSVFPAITRGRAFSDGDVIQLANLCHNCRGCYYACQYTEPHEFDLNIPQALAQVRQQSWQDATVPGLFARLFHRHGLAFVALILIAIGFFISIVGASSSSSGNINFYDLISHNSMVAIFALAFMLPLGTIFWSLRRYWKAIGGQTVSLADLRATLSQIANMKDLSGGHGDGCNFEDEDRFSNLRRWLHQLVMYGFLLCFAATSVATLMHYFLDLPAPYSLFSLPKLFGISGGVLLSIGTLGMAILKPSGNRQLGDSRVWNGEFAFICLLFLVSSSGLALYAFSATVWLRELLIVHLAAVLSFFLLMPYSKMVHGFYRFAAILRDVQLR